MKFWKIKNEINFNKSIIYNKTYCFNPLLNESLFTFILELETLNFDDYCYIFLNIPYSNFNAVFDIKDPIGLNSFYKELSKLDEFKAYITFVLYL